MDKIKTDRVVLRKFGFLLAFCFALISLMIKLKNYTVPLAVTSLFFILIASFAPVILKYFYIFWIKFARIISWVNTRLLLGIIFYFVFAPVGLLRRLLRIDLLERKPKPLIVSYWKPKVKDNVIVSDYHRQS
jgi:hypothetical protein